MKNLNEMSPNEQGIVSEVRGGRGIARRLENMGIRRGSRIKKISTQYMKGPVTIQAGGSQVAIGHGMASKIFVAAG